MKVNPFGDSLQRSKESMLGRAVREPTFVLLVACLAIGFALVAWRTAMHVSDARARASAEALSAARAVELQFGKALSTAELLGTLARQSGGAMPDFQRVGEQLLTSRPGLAS